MIQQYSTPGIFVEIVFYNIRLQILTQKIYLNYNWSKPISQLFIIKLILSRDSELSHFLFR